MKYGISAWRQIYRNRTALAGCLMTIGVVLFVTLGDLFVGHTTGTMDFMNILMPPSWQHPYGTDSFGRDVLARVMAGARVSLVVSVTAIGLAAVFGTICGVLSAWYRGIPDVVFMRLADLLFAFPSFVLALLLMVALGYGITNVILAIALVYFPIFARIARNMTLVIQEEPFVMASRIMGHRPVRIMLCDILPNISAPLVVQASAGVAFAIILEAGLSFVGLGIQPPTPSLGTIMADGREYFTRGPWVLTLSGLTISVALLGLNLLGDGLRDMTDPKLRVRLA